MPWPGLLLLPVTQASKRANAPSVCSVQEKGLRATAVRDMDTHFKDNHSNRSQKSTLTGRRRNAVDQGKWLNSV